MHYLTVEIYYMIKEKLDLQIKSAICNKKFYKKRGKNCILPQKLGFVDFFLIPVKKIKDHKNI